MNRDAIGSRVRVTTADGQTRMQEVICGTSLGAGSELSLHFGLGDHEQISELEIIWPDGLRQSFSDVAGNQRVALAYPVDAEAEAAETKALYGEPRAGWITAGIIILGLALIGSLILFIAQGRLKSTAIS